MYVLIVHGVRVRHEALFTHRAFCGRCVDVTSQQVFRVLEQAHLYFVSIGAPDRREASRCEKCGHVVGCRADALHPGDRDPWARLPVQDRARLETDAFLRAHADVSIKVRWTPRVIAWAVLMAAALAGIGWLTASLFNVGFAACGLVLGLAPVALFAHREAARRAIERDVAHEIEPGIARLLERTGGRFRALPLRARELRLESLARLLGSPAFARASREEGPYR